VNVNEFDKLLGDVLMEDSQVEPLTGLEGRVLKRIAENGTPARNRVPMVWGFGALTACLVAVAFISTEEFHSKHRNLRNTASIVAHIDKPGVEVPPMPAPILSPFVKKITVANREFRRAGSTKAEQAVLPKEDVFPAPSLPSESVRELAELNRHQVEVSGLADAGLRGKAPAPLIVVPIQIAAIEIEPIVPLPK